LTSSELSSSLSTFFATAFFAGTFDLTSSELSSSLSTFFTGAFLVTFFGETTAFFGEAATLFGEATAFLEILLFLLLLFYQNRLNHCQLGLF